jgi:hypothetical protein
MNATRVLRADDHALVRWWHSFLTQENAGSSSVSESESGPRDATAGLKAALEFSGRNRDQRFLE